MKQIAPEVPTASIASAGLCRVTADPDNHSVSAATVTDNHCVSAATAEEGLNTRLVSQAVRRAQLGDREALGFLYARFSENIFGYVRSIVRDHHEAEDVTQHVFAKMMRVIDKYEERDVPFFAWLLRVARNVAVDYIRSERLVPVEEVRAETTRGGDPTVLAWTEDLREALATLPQAQREVLIMRHVAGLSPAEIAGLTGKSEGSIHGLHHRGRRAMAAELTSRGLAPATMVRRGAAVAGDTIAGRSAA